MLPADGTEPLIEERGHSIQRLGEGLHLLVVRDLEPVLEVSLGEALRGLGDPLERTPDPPGHQEAHEEDRDDGEEARQGHPALELADLGDDLGQGATGPHDRGARRLGREGQVEGVLPEGTAEAPRVAPAFGQSLQDLRPISVVFHPIGVPTRVGDDPPVRRDEGDPGAGLGVQRRRQLPQVLGSASLRGGDDAPDEVRRLLELLLRALEVEIVQGGEGVPSDPGEAEDGDGEVGGEELPDQLPRSRHGDSLKR